MSNISRVNSLRMTGLASGLDIDGMVKKMLTNQQSKLHKAKQQKAFVNWQKDAYRSVITTLNGFQSKFLDIISPASITRAGSFKSTIVTVPPSMSQYFSAAASSDAVNSSVTVNSIDRIATAQKLTAVDGHKIAKPVMMTVSANDMSSIVGKSISFSLNGETKNIVIENHDETDINVLVNDINGKLENLFGKQNGVARIAVGNVEPLASGDKYNLTFDVAPNNTVQIAASNEVRAVMSFSNNMTNYVSTDRTAGELFSQISTAPGGDINFSINEVDFTFSQGTSMKEIINEINKSEAGVNIAYSSFSDSFVMTAKNTGEGNNIRLVETSGSDFFKQMFGESVTPRYDFGDVTDGQNALLKINGVEIDRSSNTIEIDGVTINLLQVTPENFSNNKAVEVKIDSSAAVDIIKTFVEEYNSLIKTLTGLLNEKRAKNSGAYYMPLSDEQKAEMNEKDIEAWEEAGKTGLLNNDPAIARMVSSMRTAIMGSVETENGKISFASIGIKPSSYFEDSTGKLVIDEEKLIEALERNPDAVTNLFTQLSPIPKDAKLADYFQKDAANGLYYKTENGVKKYVSENDLKNMRNSALGVAQRFSEIFHNSINVSINSGERGSLILKVGTGGSNIIVDRESTLEKQIASMDINITKIQNKLYATETRLYKKFSTFETALTKLNSQASYLLSNGEQSQ